MDQIKTPVLLDDDQFIWNPNTDEAFIDASIRITNGNYSVIADNNIDRGSIIYHGGPLSSQIAYHEEEDKSGYNKWAIKILQHVNGHDENIYELYPRNKDVSLDVDQITQKLLLNAWNVYGKYLLYIGGSKFNHSCVPNAGQWIDQESNKMTIRAFRQIKKDEEITICYIGKLMVIDNIESRAKILEEWQIKCTCLSCLNQNKPQPMDYSIGMANSLEGWVKDNKIINCVWCGKDGEFLKCGKCGIPRYCGKECQKRHWHLNHKKQCLLWNQRRSYHIMT